MPTVVAVSASRRRPSYTRAALRCALDAAAAHGAETDLIDLGAPDVDLPLYHPDRDSQGDSDHLRRRVRTADGVLVGSPVYHGSYASTFKNFHDYCSADEYENTAVGLLVTAGGGSYGGTLEHLRATLRNVHAWVIPHQVGISGASDKLDDDGQFLDEDLEARTERLGRQVLAHARQLGAD